MRGARSGRQPRARGATDSVRTSSLICGFTVRALSAKSEPRIPTKLAALEMQLLQAGSVERRGYEQSRPEGNRKGVRKHDVRPPEAVPQG